MDKALGGDAETERVKDIGATNFLDEHRRTRQSVVMRPFGDFDPTRMIGREEDGVTQDVGTRDSSTQVGEDVGQVGLRDNSSSTVGTLPFLQAGTRARQEEMHNQSSPTDSSFSGVSDRDSESSFMSNPLSSILSGNNNNSSSDPSQPSQQNGQNSSQFGFLDIFRNQYQPRVQSLGLTATGSSPGSGKDTPTATTTTTTTMPTSSFEGMPI